MGSFDISLLREDLSFVRRLARDLAGDEASAEDVVQEAYRTLLERPPEHTQNLRAYLAILIRRLSWKRRLRDDRRVRRERAAARPEQISAEDDPLARVEIHRLAVEALVNLREPYRKTLLLRYLDELPVAEVAQRLDVPIETVRTRIKRGLALLREELDRRHPGGRSDWLAGLVGLAKGAPPAGAALPGEALPGDTATGLRGLRRGATWKLATAVGIGGGVVLTALLGVRELRRSGSVDAHRAAGPSIPAGEQGDLVGGANPQRVEVAPPLGAPAAPPTVPDPLRKVLSGLVIGVGGPVAGAPVSAYASRIDGSEPLGQTTTNEAGRFVLELEPWYALPPGQREASMMLLAAHAPGHHENETLHSDWRRLFEEEVVLSLSAGRVVTGVARDVAGDVVPWAFVTAHLRVPDESGLQTIPDSADELGHFVTNLPAGAQLVTLEVRSLTKGLARPDTTGFGTGDIELGDVVLEPLGEITGRVVHPDGAPAPWTIVYVDFVAFDSLRAAYTLSAASALGSAPGASDSGDSDPGVRRAHAYADAEGRFEIRGLARGFHRVSVGMRTTEDEPVREDDVLATGSKDVVLLSKATRLLIAVEDAEGRSVRGVAVHLSEFSEQGRLLRTRKTLTRTSAGQAILAVPPGRTVAFHAETRTGLSTETRLVVPESPFELHYELILRPARGRARLQLQVSGPRGEGVPTWDVTLLTEHAGQPVSSFSGLTPQQSGESGVLNDLPPGRYRLRVRPTGDAADAYLPSDTEVAVELHDDRTSRALVTLGEGSRLRLELRATDPLSAEPEAISLAGTLLSTLVCEPSELTGLSLAVQRLSPTGVEAYLELEGSQLERAAREGIPLPLGRYLLTFRSKRFQDHDEEVVIENGPHEPHVVVLHTR